MHRNFLFFIFIFFLVTGLFAQETEDSSGLLPIDTLPQVDSSLVKDSVFHAETIDSLVQKPLQDTITENKLYGDAFDSKNVLGGKEILFYAIIFLLLLFAFLNRLFPKYFNDLYRLFFRTTLNQSQIREQMMQSPLPSLSLNIFFVITGGMYLNFLFHHYGIKPVDNFWLLFLYCGLGLAVIYFIKYVGLKFSGWIFYAREAADSYIFIVFVINKMIGVFLLPIIVILAFTSGDIYQMGITFSFIGIGAFLIYRIILTYTSVRNQIKVSPFHFILYILAFEILPLWIIYKLLLVILEITA